MPAGKHVQSSKFSLRITAQAPDDPVVIIVSSILGLLSKHIEPSPQSRAAGELIQSNQDSHYGRHYCNSWRKKACQPSHGPIMRSYAPTSAFRPFAK